ncbi:hypothetical protein B0H17DRAFT_917470, partial [Mycena rosella]
STPIFASIISLLNDQLIAAGKPPLEFLNPWLYAHPEMFTDIPIGTNPGLPPSDGCGAGGFAATAGWDPATVPAFTPTSLGFLNISFPCTGSAHPTLPR